MTNSIIPFNKLADRTLVRSAGCYIYDANNKEYIDFESGNWATNPGHSHVSQTLVNTIIRYMNPKNIPFQTIDWSLIPKTEHPGDPGIAWWQTLLLEGLRIRIVEYSKGYVADHWCTKGHIVHCLEGDFISELSNGEKFLLTSGMTYVVTDELSSHRSTSENGVKLLIVDGDFLKKR